MTLDPDLDYYKNKGVLPPFVSPSTILKDCLPSLAPLMDYNPVEAADEFRKIDGQSYDSAMTPYINEPSLMTTSRRYKAVIYVGTVQSGKTTGLVDNTVLHRMLCDPCDVHITQMDQNAAKRYSRGKIEKMLRETDVLRAKLMARAGTLGNVFDKYFRGDATLTMGWPVVSQLSSRDIPTVITTDRDRMPDDIEGEGDILALSIARNTRFGSRGMSIVESSPGRNVIDEDFKSSTIHEAPPCAGILGYYNSGTRARYYWKCPSCKQKFEPEFHHLRSEGGDTPYERGQSVYLLCPNQGCGGVMLPGDKYDLNQPENGAGWLHESNCGTKAVPLGDPDIRKSDMVSYWQKGCQAAFQSWQDMFTAHDEALEKWKNTGEESTLKTTINTKLGLPYLSPSRENSLELSAKYLEERAIEWPRDKAPVGTHFITVSVDVQPSRFVVSVDAWGKGLEHWLIQRYDLTQPPDHLPDADKRSVVTNLYEEDWQLLNNLHEAVYSVDGTDYGLKPNMIIIDSGGAPGTTELAYKFWLKKYKANQVGTYFIYKGVGGLDANKPRAKLRAPENRNSKKRRNRDEVKIVFTATNRLKDEISASLRRDNAGPLTFHLPKGLGRNIYDEFCAERRTDSGQWEKKPGKVRNESLDLAVMAKAVCIIKGAEKMNWDKPYKWAVPSIENSNAVKVDKDGEPLADHVRVKSSGASLAARRKGFVKRR